jgi:hypothetical protein
VRRIPIRHTSVELQAHEMQACEVHTYEIHAHEGFCEDLAPSHSCPRSRYGFGVVTYGFLCCHIWVSMLSHMGFYVVAYGFQSPLGYPKDHYLGRCTVCLGTSAHRPCFDLSVFSLSVYHLSVHHFSVHFDWLANPIACASFPRLTLPHCR